jgi:RimJ/RimL family protein N-acetyltransferase
MTANRFPYHSLRLESERLTLRPFLEADFGTALPFYRDPDFVNLMEGDPPDEVSVEYLMRAGESMARQGFFFAIEEKETGDTIGEVCLQWMNLDRANVEPGEKVTRLPIGIWDKRLWGRGYGSEVVRRLIAYAFEVLEVDRFCAMDVKVTNTRSRALWASCGLRPVREVGDHVDFEVSKERYFKGHESIED